MGPKGSSPFRHGLCSQPLVSLSINYTSPFYFLCYLWNFNLWWTVVGEEKSPYYLNSVALHEKQD